MVKLGKHTKDRMLALLIINYWINYYAFNPNSIGGRGINWPCDACLENTMTAVFKKNIPVLYCLSHDKDLKFQFNITEILTLTNTEVKQRHGQFDITPLPNTITISVK